MLILLMSFIKSSATKCVSLNNEPCMIRPFLINLTHDEIKYYPFLIKLDKYNRNFNPVNDLSMRICVPSKTKDVNVKVFNMITKGNEAKTPAKHNSCDCKYKFIGIYCNSNQKWNNEPCQSKCKNCRTSKIYYKWNPSTCICENGMYLKGIVKDSKIVCDEIIYDVDIVSGNMGGIISTNIRVLLQ